MRGKILVSLVLMTLGIHVFSQEPESDRIREAKYKNAIGCNPLLPFLNGMVGSGSSWNISYQRLIDRFGIELALRDREYPNWDESFDEELRESEIELQVSYAPFWHFFSDNNNTNAYAYISSEWISEYEPKKQKLPFSLSNYSIEDICAGIGSETSLGHFSIYIEIGLALRLFDYHHNSANTEINNTVDFGIRIRF